MIRLVIPGDPAAKQRARVNTKTGRAYTPAGTVSAEQAIQGVWMHNGSPRLEDGPLTLTVEAVMRRPKNHWLRDGTLSAPGRRSGWPTRKPDLDNIYKLCADALNGRAYTDDAFIVSSSVWKRWAHAGEQAHTVIELTLLPGRHA